MVDITEHELSNMQLCICTPIIIDDVTNTTTFTLLFNDCPNVSNTTHLELTKYHIILLATLCDKNNNLPLHDKILITRPVNGLCSYNTQGFCMDNDEYAIFKNLIYITETVNEVTNGHIENIDISVTQELMLRLDNKWKTSVFGYGQTIITEFFKYHRSTYDLITCLTINLLQHPKLVNRLNIILKIRPAYINKLTKVETVDTNISNTTIIINANDKYTVSQIINKAQLFISKLYTEFADAGTPVLSDLEAELFLECGLSYDLMRESVVNFNQFQLVDMDVVKALLCNTTDSIAINKDLKKTAMNINIFKVKYNHRELSRDFDGANNLLFHGSPIINWHSLLYNGPYVPDKKNGLIDNGAAHGIGVYLSTQSSTSISYSASGLVHQLQTKNDKIMMGVFQVKNMENYKKASHVYVCPNTDDLCLKYLIYGKYNDINKLLSYLDKFRENGAGNIVRDIQIKQSKRGIKRLMGEIKRMSARNGILSDDGLLFNFELLEDKTNIWRIKLPMEENFRNMDYKPTSNQQPLLYQDARKYKINTLEIEITFPEDYPFRPPFVRIVSPRFMFMTGHVTSGGSVCTELLTDGGWVQTTSAMSLILMLKQNLYDGGARIDPTKLGQVYGYDEACAAYNRMLRNHPEWQPKHGKRG